MPTLLALLLVVLLVPLAARGAEAQTTRVDNSGTGRIAGSVVDAESLQPLGGVVVRLDAVASVGGEPRSTVTDVRGAYVFAWVPAGRYRLRVERIGYLPRALEVDLMPGDQASIGFRLEFEPVRLPVLEIVGARPQSFAGAGDDGSGIAPRVEVSRLRQQRYLAGDVRMMTEADVVEAVTLGEPDLFRALQRTPGVTTRDDYTATLWTRGASWDQTRVFLDGLPLYNPTHAGWLFSAVNPDGLGEVTFFPGYRSARWSEGTAAVLDLRTKSGGASGEFGGVGELSPASLRLQLDGRALDDRVRWMVAGRRTHVDLLTRLAGAVTDRDDLDVPYDFLDVLGRVDGDLGGGWGLEASGILERDNLRGDVTGLLEDNTGRWGNVSGRLTLRAPLPGWSLPLPGALPALGLGPAEARLTVGGTTFEALVREELGPGRAPTLPSIENLIRHRRVELELAPADGERHRWAMGAQLVWDTVHYSGTSILAGLTLPPELREELEPYTTGNPLTYGALWAQRRFRPHPRLTLEAGVRTEIGDSVYNGGIVRTAPRFAARFALAPTTLLSASWSRAFQYTQDVAPAAGPIGPQLHLSALWVLARPSSLRPAARADVASLGVEQWIGAGWLFGASAYRRTASGLLIPNPDPGPVTLAWNPEAVGSNEARGIDLSLRRLAGRWTGSLGYSWGRSTIEAVRDADGELRVLRFPAAADVRHAVDVTGVVRLGPRWRAGGAFTYGSGIPFTRLVLPDTSAPSTQPGPDLAVLGEPNAERTPPYASLDLLVDYARRVGGLEISIYGQLRNALNRENAVTYLGSRQCGAILQNGLLSGGVECDGRTGGVQDRFEGGLPRLPLVGIRIRF